jgi:hypothetical protein
MNGSVLPERSVSRPRTTPTNPQYNLEDLGEPFEAPEWRVQ